MTTEKKLKIAFVLFASWMVIESALVMYLTFKTISLEHKLHDTMQLTVDIGEAFVNSQR